MPSNCVLFIKKLFSRDIAEIGEAIYPAPAVLASTAENPLAIDPPAAQGRQSCHNRMINCTKRHRAQHSVTTKPQVLTRRILASLQSFRESALFFFCKNRSNRPLASTGSCWRPAGGEAYRIFGITYSAPARMPAGQRAVTALKRVGRAHAFGAVRRHVAKATIFFWPNSVSCRLGHAHYVASGR